MSKQEFIDGVQWLAGYMAAINKHGVLENENHPEYTKAVEVSRFALRLVDECNNSIRSTS